MAEVISFEIHVAGHLIAGSMKALPNSPTLHSKFGGDSTKATINDQSAGGSSVELNMIANEGEQPFFRFYASYAGCGTGSVAEKMTCLRGASVSALVQHNV
ncbi:uncharacterized protein EDB93DRAFT_1150125 [Suillus bovinus]|uniref:uncharacterized protein n=1 Tax=Suillus bovinus TaxID=48563 RepID=UPI001B86FBDD|nr:uncharacterized protein EDB93DRAFT_1150125 [Suillus bovinus]KAG2146179.1 hypothetical protein EDB93DRAFT_1150125 [Suillus bovinus]